MVLLGIAVFFFARPFLVLVHALFVGATLRGEDTTGIRLVTEFLIAFVNQGAIVVLSILLYDDYQSLIKVIGAMFVLGIIQGIIQYFTLKIMVWATTETDHSRVRVSSYRSDAWNNPGSSPPPGWHGDEEVE